MTPDALRDWLPTIVTLGGLAAHLTYFVYRKGGERNQLAADKDTNARQHNTLDGKIRHFGDELGDVRKAAVRAHERIDQHAIRLGMLDANGQSLKEQMVSGFADIHASLRDLRKDIMDVLKKQNGGNS